MIGNCESCRRRIGRRARFGPAPRRCEDCNRRRHAARQKPYDTAKRAAAAAGVPFEWKGPGVKFKKVVCSGCRTSFLWEAKNGWGHPPARCPSCAKTRRNKLAREAYEKRRKAREAAAAAPVDVGGYLAGCAPLNYRPETPSARCLHCLRSYATTRRSGRFVCPGCLGKGLR